MEWITGLESWRAFEEMRRAKGKRAPFTERARERIIMDLKRLHAQGQDVDNCLWTSVKNGWSGVYPARSCPQAAAPGQMALPDEVAVSLQPLSAAEYERSMVAKRAAMARLQQMLPGLQGRA